MGSLLILAATLAATFTVPPEKARGGDARVFTQHVIELERAKTQVRVLLPSCGSACTIYLIANDVCISPDTKFNFHGPADTDTVLSTGERGLTQKRIDDVTRVVANNYELRRPGLGRWYLKEAAHLWGHDYVTLTGRDIHYRFHVPYC